MLRRAEVIGEPCLGAEKPAGGRTVRWLLLLLLGCHPDRPEVAGSGPRAWPGGDVRPELDHPMFDVVDLPPLSLYATKVEGPVADRPDFRIRGPFGVGNRAVFGLVGLDDPVNAIHGMTGPTYSLGGRFFHDQAFELEVDGEVVALETEWVARPRGTALAITRADAGDLSLYTLDFAPIALGEDVGPPIWIRRFGVRNRGGEAHVVRVLGGASTGLGTAGGYAVDDTTERLLGYLSDGWTIEGGRPVASLGSVGSREQAAMDLALGVAGDPAGLDALAADVAAADVDQWLAETVAWWADFSAVGLQLETSDPRWADLYDANRTVIGVQTTNGGGVSPMSRYTSVWLRDTAGAVRFLARAGRIDDARRAVTYLHACHTTRGDYGNACDSDIDLGAVPAEPDWASMGAFGGRTAAEGPSYVPLAADMVARWSGDRSVVEAHFDWLARGVLAQQMEPDGRQTWSGDETFRLVMGAALGYPLEYDFPGLAWSTNSSLVMEAAATRMAEQARALGRDPAPFEERAALARQALEHFRQPDGHYAAVEWHSKGIANDVGIDPRPFEDVNLKELWLGIADPSDPEVLANLDAVRAQADRGDGDWVSPVDPTVDTMGIEVGDGVLTGMNPGYALFALTAVDDPDADLAFDALHRWARTSGSFPEDAEVDDHGALQVIYDRNGVLSDISARYRPWEGGIDAEALLAYLIGAEPLADGGVRLHPHLPNDQPWLVATGMVVGGHELDLRVGADAVKVTARDAVTVTVERCGDEPATRELSAGESWSFER